MSLFGQALILTIRFYQFVFGSEESNKAAFIADYIESELGFNWSIDPTGT